MADKVNLEQKIQRFRQANPRLENLTDKQILSVMVENGEITLSEAQKVSIYSNTQSNVDNQGLTVQKQTKSRTINLKSGRKIVIKDDTVKYYAADGVELKKEYFEKQEGQIDVKPSGRYSVTKAGKTKYYAADGTELKESYFKQVENTDIKVKSVDGKTYNLNKTLENRINKVTVDLKKSEDNNGFIGTTWSGFKNLTGIGDSSDKVREQQEEEKKLLQQFNSNEQKRPEIFKELTGAEYTPENLEKFIKGEIKLKSEIALQGYNEGQEMAVDITADIVSGIAAVGIYTAAVAAAPFTGGASIAVGVVAAGASGSVIKTGLKAADAATGGREYTLQDAKHDAATGAFSGIIAPITGGLGGAIGKTVATKLGVQAVKQVGKEVAQEGANIGVKATLKTALTNPTGYEYIGGNAAKRGLAFAAETATDGAVGGAVDNAFRTAYDGGGVNEVLEAAAEGFVGGAIMSPIIGGGMKATGKAGQKVFGKDNVHIDANKNVIHTDVVFDLLNNKVDMDYAAAVFRDIDDLEQAFRVADLDISDKEKEHLYRIKEQLIKKVNKNIADHGSIVLQTEIPAERSVLKSKVKEGHKLTLEPEQQLKEIPSGKLAAPNSKFAETPKAFADVITKRINDFREANNIKNDKQFYEEVLRIFKEEMKLGETTPRLNFNETHQNARAAYSDTDNVIYVFMNNFPKDRAEGVAILAHELKHFFQFKEELLTGEPEEAIDGLINAKAKNLVRTNPQLSQEQAQAIVQQWYIQDGDYKSHIYDILLNEGWNRNELDDIWGYKVQEYLKNEEHYIDKKESLSIDNTLKSYENQITEREAYEVGDAVGTAFNKDVLGLDKAISTRESLGLKNIKNIAVYKEMLGKDILTAEDAKKLFPEGIIKKNFYIESIQKLIDDIPNEVKNDPNFRMIDLSPQLTDKDFEIIATLMNLHKNDHLYKWFEKNPQNGIENIQSLALFARVVDFTNQHKDFLEFNANQWDIVLERVLTKPEKLVDSLLKYKYNSSDINQALDSGIYPNSKV